jgi:hypothetical protein
VRFLLLLLLYQLLEKSFELERNLSFAMSKLKVLV